MLHNVNWFMYSDVKINFMCWENSCEMPCSSEKNNKVRSQMLASVTKQTISSLSFYYSFHYSELLKGGLSVLNRKSFMQIVIN